MAAHFCALAAVEKDSTGNEIEMASTLNTLAWVLLASARYAEATSYAARSQTLLEAVKAPAKNRIDTLTTLAALYAVTGRFDEACSHMQTAIHDAEDAFQSTFMVLVRRAASVVPRNMVANWLYGVAHQTALHARRTIGRRRLKEKQVTVLPEPAAACPDLWH